MSIKRHCILLFSYLISYSCWAQEPMLAERNRILTVSCGLTNADAQLNKPNTEYGYSHQLEFSRPLSICFDYAIRDHITLGAVVGYSSYSVIENHNLSMDSSWYSIKGQKAVIQLRSLRYLFHRPKSMLYLFAHAGVRLVSNEITSNQNNTLVGSSFASTELFQKQPFPVSFETGLGFKYLVYKNIAINAEVGVLNSIAQLGIGYRFLEASRKKIDQFGW